MSFIKQLLSSKSEISSKRFISLYALVLLTGVVIASVCGVVVQIEIIYALTGLVAGSSLMTLTQSKTTNEGNVDSGSKRTDDFNGEGNINNSEGLAG